MAKFVRVVFCWKNLLVLSLALNVSLILRYVNEGKYKSQDMGRQSESRPFAADDPKAEAFVAERLRFSAASSSSAKTSHAEDGPDRVINLDHGDPTVYENFWQQQGDKTTVVIPGWKYLSYFSDVTNVCWFLEHDFAEQVKRLHKLVGNAVTEDRHIVVGTGSSQLYLAVLYALSPQDASTPMNVVSAAPYYSAYPLMTDCVKSGLYKWAGDAHSFNNNGPYIELVTSPNNPDGAIRTAVINRTGGILVHDFAYYWPQYTPISAPADHDIMLFTVSKSTGHAGMRIGWALVKDKEVAKRMTKYIELNTIGVSKDSQLRAATILKTVSDGCEEKNDTTGCFFESGFHILAERWRKLRETVKQSGAFSIVESPSEICRYLHREFETQSAFAWVKCEGEVEDCESFFRSHRILTRGGKHFGFSPKFVRISMLDRDRNFDIFIKRLLTI